MTMAHDARRGISVAALMVACASSAAAQTTAKPAVITPGPAGATVTLGPVTGGDTYSIVSTAPAAVTGAGYFTVFDNSAGQFRMVIAPNGNAGLGTTTPIAQLHVSSDNPASTSFILENLVGQASRQIIVSNYGSAGGGPYWTGLDSANTSSLLGPNLFVLRATGGLAFSGSSTAEHMRIKPDGRISIGTTQLTEGRVEVHDDGPNATVIAAISGSQTGNNTAIEGLTYSTEGGRAVSGFAANSGVGVYATSNNGDAVHAWSGVGFGVFAETYGGAAINAVNNATSGFADGVRAITNSPAAVGLWARNLAAGGGTAGRFDGNVAVYGTLTKSSGSFKIDHPLDPENQYLYHSFVESPDMMNIYNDVVTTDATGTADVALPAWFEALNADFRYQLTCIGTFAQAIIAEEIRDSRFVIRTSSPNVKVSWQVTGIRHDPWAEHHRSPVEEVKPDGERGYYLHPEVYGQSPDKGISPANRTPRPVP